MMRTLGQGKAEKDAVWGALQWRRGEAPNAALRLSPTFAADNGQRIKPHAVSAAINARAKPHATARRMLSKSPYQASTNNWMRRSYREPPSKATSAEISIETKGARGADGNAEACGAVWRSPSRIWRRGCRSAFSTGGPASRIRELRALRPESGGEWAGLMRNPDRAINSLLRPFTQPSGTGAACAELASGV